MGWAMMIVGLLISLAASALLLLGVIQSGATLVLGVLGIGMIAISGRWLPKKPDEKPIEKQVEQTIYAPDRQLRALVSQRADGHYRVVIEKFLHDYSPDQGSQDRWERQPDVTVTDTLASAVEVAARSVGAGTDSFF